MKIAYLISLYPAQSHTFIEREIAGLRALGVEISTFSVRRPRPGDVLGETAKVEAGRTRWLMPPPVGSLLSALCWAAHTRPRLSLRVLADALANSRGMREKLKWLAYFVEAVLLARWIDDEGGQHLHCHFGNSGSSTALLASQLVAVPLSITFHGIDLDDPETFRHAKKLQRCAFAICISEFGRSLLLENTSPSYADKVHVVRCGCVPPPEEDIEPAPRSGRIICVARLSPEKGHKILLEALSLLRQRGVGFHCTFVGGGPLEQEIRNLAELLGLSVQVTLTGPLPPSQVAEQLKRSDVAVLASYGEGIPVVILEAFGYRRPVVATCVGGIPELVRSGENGFLVPPGNATALADALQALLGDSALAASFGEQGRRAVLSRHDPETAAEEMRRLFSAARGGTRP